MTICTLGVLMLLSSFLQSQTPQLEVGPEVRYIPSEESAATNDFSHAQLGASSRFYDNMGDSSYFYILGRLSSDDPMFIVQKFSSKTLGMIYSKDVYLPKINKKYTTYEKTLLVDGQLMICSVISNKDDTRSAYVTSVDDAGNGLAAKELFVTPIEGKRSANYDFFVSEDTKQLFITCTKPKPEGTTFRFSVKTFDKALNSGWEKEFEMPYTGDCDLVSPLLDRQSNFHALMLHGNDIDYAIDCLSYDHKEQKTVTNPIVVKDMFPFDFKLGLSKSGNLICGGLYSKEKPKKITFSGTYKPLSQMHGMFCYLIDKTTFKIAREEHVDIENVKGQELWRYNMNYILSDTGDMVTLLCQLRFTNSFKNGDIGSPNRTKTVETIIGPVYVGKFKGENASVTKVNVYDKNYLKGGAGRYAVIEKQHTTYLLFSDYTTLRASPVIAAVVYGDGKLEQNIIFESSVENKQFFFFHHFILSGKNSMIVPASRKFNSHFVKISFK